MKNSPNLSAAQVRALDSLANAYGEPTLAGEFSGHTRAFRALVAAGLATESVWQPMRDSAPFAAWTITEAGSTAFAAILAQS